MRSIARAQGAVGKAVQTAERRNASPSGYKVVDFGHYIAGPAHDTIDGGTVVLFAPCAIRAAGATMLSFPPAEKYGASTRHVLKQLGYSDEEIDGLIRARCVATSWSTQYLPD